ncbi:UDP-2,3-diacylglucosamine diphosphatase [Vibrio sp. JC009]|uniref:UDP-2,3-diacylglucosamine diphosphatase n=1 Tax=Vibrio sp. JC009 TaxID=2912314 RepID=UPI0023B15CD5|nr:UDP-2,3-diacylglucosamine diphosphatase [Vibrio sp. JC009]WED23277.1 UDP-2,3-diacylglucosamine diphosphatase [Vibrio sp. JC009]
MTTFFIADLHLTPSRPDITHCFFEFMRNEAASADALYVLGDLFEFWVGDDDNNSFNQSIKQEFRKLTDSGVPCFFAHGNRDFLVGKRFGKETGVTLLGDESVIDLYGTRAVIMHGDTLCTDDLSYIAYREKVHKPWLQWLYNRLPLSVKLKIVAKVQSDIGEDKKQKSLDIMDVNQQEVERVMQLHNCNLMIHGHTHRPGTHVFASDGAEKTRVVLGDWYTQSSVLECTPGKQELQSRNFLSETKNKHDT